MAQCKECKREVGCGCNLKGGLCPACVQKAEEAKKLAEQQKISVTIKIPTEDANIRS